jgi:hypothetical protein
VKSKTKTPRCCECDRAAVGRRKVRRLTLYFCAAHLPPAKRHKYHAVATEADGIKFPSKRQARRYVELKALLDRGDISVTEAMDRFGRWMEVPFTLHGADGKAVCVYRADFVFREPGNRRLVVEDPKGYKTDAYRLKRKLFLAEYGADFEHREI